MCAFTVYDDASDEPAAVPEGETGNVRLVKKMLHRHSSKQADSLKKPFIASKQRINVYLSL